jgi:hypothetical protein
MIFSEPLRSESVLLDAKMKKKETFTLKMIYLRTIIENETLILVIYTDNNRSASCAQSWAGK